MNNNTNFYKWFETIASKLGNREISFRKVFKYLDAQPTPIIIVETGCLRVKDNFWMVKVHYYLINIPYQEEKDQKYILLI